jgi:hypothetical protein
MIVLVTGMKSYLVIGRITVYGTISVTHWYGGGATTQGVRPQVWHADASPIPATASPQATNPRT